MTVKIRDVRAICTKPAEFNLVVVRIDTSEPGLYGLGCATFTFKYEAVAMVVNEWFRPLLIGRDVSRIEEIWQMLNVSSYWRNGPIINNAISGVDIALWDIKGKMANMPLYDLLGGKTRGAVPIYRYAESTDLDDLAEKVRGLMDEGVRHVRIQWTNCKDVSSYCFTPEDALEGNYIDPLQYCRDTIRMFDHIRNKIGYEVELCHDVHERIAPSSALWLVKQLEPYNLFFLEDVLPPEQGGWFKHLKAQTVTPLAQGELFNNSREWEDLVKDRLIDFMRVHISQIGGITPAKKLAAFCEQFGVRMAWHGPPDMSPVGYAVNIHMDLTIHNLGIQEWSGIEDILYEVFPGTPYIKRGYAYINEKAGLGIEFDEKLAAEFPCSKKKADWLEMRLPDGTMQKP